MPFAAAVSVHPISAHATGEVIGRVVEDVGTHPDLLVLMVTPGHAGALEDMARTVRTLLAPSVLIAATASSVVGQGARDDGSGPGVALWAGLTGPTQAFRWTGPSAWSGDRVGPSFRARGAIVLGDALSCADDTFLHLLGERLGGVPIAGGLSTAGPLVLDDHVYRSGAVAAALGPGVSFDVVVSQGWRAVGPRLSVTDADAHRGLIRELDGMPALPRLQRLATDEVPSSDVAFFNQGLAIGPEVVGPASSAARYEVRGADRRNGAIATDGPIPAGTEVRFWVRGDPGADLRRVLAPRHAESALAFVADPLQRRYETPEGDAEIIEELLGTTAVTGMVASAQIAPIGPDLRLLRSDASVALMSPR